MRKKVVYVCEHCKGEFLNADDALKCEAGHLNLTLEEYNEYLSLLEKEKYCGIKISCTKNEHTEKEFEEAIKNVIDFKKKHNIVDNK